MADRIELLCAEIAAGLSRAHERTNDHRVLTGAQRVAALVHRPPHAVEPVRFPVVDRWLDPACELATEDTRPLAELIANVSGDLSWHRSYPNDADDPVIAHLRQGYAYALIAAPATSSYGQAPIASADVLVALTIQAPNVLYPRHHHPAVEMYGVVAGNAIWLDGSDQWYHRAPGCVVAHDEHEVHAMATGNDPLLNYVVWLSDFDGASSLVGSQS